jgi:hypothetical protein
MTPMPTPTERDIFIKASRGHEILGKALAAFREYLESETDPGSPEYYRARNLLKEGRTFCADVVREAKKLLGPVPVYAPREYEEMRLRTLEENRITIRGEDPEAIRRQLAADSLVRSMMSEDEIDAYLRDHLEAQRSGKRKLMNLKVRLLIDRLYGLAEEGLAAQKAAQRKQQGLPPE